jgi:alpha-galactosidase/6-phospho-beta-glucosidase family protein
MQMRENNIVVVGGGSQFAIGLMESFIDYGQDMLAGSRVVLLDINEPQREKLCQIIKIVSSELFQRQFMRGVTAGAVQG